jgi:hypothetical protein
MRVWDLGFRDYRLREMRVLGLGVWGSDLRGCAGGRGLPKEIATPSKIGVVQSSGRMVEGSEFGVYGLVFGIYQRMWRFQGRLRAGALEEPVWARKHTYAHLETSTSNPQDLDLKLKPSRQT